MGPGRCTDLGPGRGQGCSEHVARSLLELEKNHQRLPEAKIRNRLASEWAQTLAQPLKVPLPAAHGALKAKHVRGALKSICVLRASRDGTGLHFGAQGREKGRHPLHRVTTRSLTQPLA